MHRFAFAAVAAAAAIATPAHAGETRIEGRVGIVWDGGFTDDTLGLVVGHDFDVNENVFIGIEGVADTNLSFDDPVLGVNARLGTKFKENTKVFVLGGYARATEGDADDFVVGAGAQHNFGEKSLISLQYQRSIDFDLNRVMIGYGVRF